MNFRCLSHKCVVYLTASAAVCHIPCGPNDRISQAKTEYGLKIVPFDSPSSVRTTKERTIGSLFCFFGAGDGNRTRDHSLGSCCFTIELRLRICIFLKTGAWEDIYHAPVYYSKQFGICQEKFWEISGGRLMIDGLVFYGRHCSKSSFPFPTVNACVSPITVFIEKQLRKAWAPMSVTPPRWTVCRQ